MHYLLDLETLLIFLGGQKQSGEVAVDLKRFPGLSARRGVRARLLLTQGRVTAAVVESSEAGLLLEGEAVIAGLTRLGQLSWVWTPSQPTPLLPPPLAERVTPIPPTEMDYWQVIPRRRLALTAIDRSLLPRKHWQILMLMDGTRSVAQLATLVFRERSDQALRELLEVLQDLEQSGIIMLD